MRCEVVSLVDTISEMINLFMDTGVVVGCNSTNTVESIQTMENIGQY